jgi:2-hydroxy-3-oxopropionate reductase
MRRIGLVGLGNAGRPIAERLLHAGYSLKVFDVDRSKMQFVARLGASVSSSAKEAAAELTLVVLPSSREVVDAVLGRNGVLAGLKQGAILLDLSGSAPQTAKRIEAEARKRAVYFLGATLHASGAPAVTLAQGTAGLVVGGDKGAIKRALEVLKTFAAKIVVVRDVATPKALKIAIIMMAVSGHLAAAEAAFWLAAQGIEPLLLYRVMEITESLTGARYLKRMLQGGLGKGGMMRNTKKDLSLARSVAKELGISLPLTQRASLILAQASAMGLEREDLPKASRAFYQKKSGVKFKTSLAKEKEQARSRNMPVVVRL